MTVHTIRLPDRLYGREQRTILWDDETATIEGDHSDIPWMRERIADAPTELVNETCAIPLKDPGRDPRDFWHLILAAFYPAAREPLRSTMPAVLRDVEPSELVMHPELTRVIFPDGAEDYLPVDIWDEDGGNVEFLPGGTIEVTELVDPYRGGIAHQGRPHRLSRPPLTRPANAGIHLVETPRNPAESEH